MGAVYRRPPAFMHQSARQVQGGSIDCKHPMPLPPSVRVGPDFPCVPGSAFGVEDHLEDCLVQGLEQLLVQPGPGTADGGRRHRSRLWQCDPHRPALPPQFGQRGRISRTPLREHQPEHEQHDHQRVQHAPPPLPEPVMPVQQFLVVTDYIISPC